MNTVYISGLTIVGSVSPLLTFAYLWQVKEWRIDRLKEHMRAEGIFRQLFGVVRPIILVSALGLLLFLPKTIGARIPEATLVAFTLLSLAQIVLQKQRMPVWTQKAMVLTGSSVCINIVASIVLPQVALPLLILVQPVILFSMWVLFWPVDAFAKMRIMKKAMRMRRSFADLTVVGITGSAGKTTTKELLAHMVKDQSVAVTPSHVNTEMGVSQWLIRTLSQAKPPKILIVEMGAYRPGEIHLLCRIAQPTMGIVTYVGTQHIALFGSQQRLQKTKGELIDALPENGHAFINADCALCAELAQHANCPVTKVGTAGPMDMKATDIEETPSGLTFTLEGETYSTPLHGTQNSTNILLAIAAAKELGIQKETIRKTLQTFSPPKHTFNVREENGVTILDDTHNASPASFKACMNWARNQPATQKILVTSGLIELGENQDKIHTDLGSIASDIFDRVIFLSKTNAKAFGLGFGKPVEMYAAKARKPIPKNALLACVGRMSQAHISAILES